MTFLCLLQDEVRCINKTYDKLFSVAGEQEARTPDAISDENRKFDINEFFDMAENALPISNIVRAYTVLLVMSVIKPAADMPIPWLKAGHATIFAGLTRATVKKNYISFNFLAAYLRVA